VNTLKCALDALVESGDEIGLVPLLVRTFKIQKKFQIKDDYKEKRAAWVKQVSVVSKLPEGPEE